MIINFDDGGVYDGETLNGLPHGKGIYKSEEKSYTGSWNNGMMNGFGECIYKTGSIYEGYY